MRVAQIILLKVADVKPMWQTSVDNSNVNKIPVTNRPIRKVRVEAGLGSTNK